MGTFRTPLVAVCVIGTLLVAPGCASRSGPWMDRLETPLGARWASTEHRGHPLAGRIWDARQGAFVSEQELWAAVRGARLVLLGEVHDNPDHHLLQARLVRAMTAPGRRPAIAFEMLDETQQPALDALPEGGKPNPDVVRDAVGWNQSGWPDFALYRPIFEAALDAGLPIVGANLPRSRIREASRKGMEALPPAVRGRIERQGPLAPAVLAEMRTEMADSHCGELPESMLEPLVLGQRARDAQMAERLAAAATKDGAILITGSGHARRDRGVPSYLSPEELEAGPVLALAFQEVDPEKLRPEEYEAAAREPRRVDYVVFTPGAAREDQCAKLREHLEKMKKHRAPEGAGDEGTRL